MKKLTITEAIDVIEGSIPGAVDDELIREAEDIALQTMKNWEELKEDIKEMTRLIDMIGDPNAETKYYVYDGILKYMKNFEEEIINGN